MIRTLLLIIGRLVTFQLICCTKMKGLEGVVLKLFLLTIVPQQSTFVVVNETNVDDYVIERRGGNDADLFILNYKNGSYCLENANHVYKWCNNLSASYHDPATKSGNSCGCSCRNEFPTFLPSNQTCINKIQAQSFGGKNVNQYLISFKR